MKLTTFVQIIQWKISFSDFPYELFEYIAIVVFDYTTLNCIETQLSFQESASDSQSNKTRNPGSISHTMSNDNQRRQNLVAGFEYYEDRNHTFRF